MFRRGLAAGGARAGGWGSAGVRREPVLGVRTVPVMCRPDRTPLLSAARLRSAATCRPTDRLQHIIPDRWGGGGGGGSRCGLTRGVPCVALHLGPTERVRVFMTAWRQAYQHHCGPAHLVCVCVA